MRGRSYGALIAAAMAASMAAGISIADQVRQPLIDFGARQQVAPSISRQRRAMRHRSWTPSKVRGDPGARKRHKAPKPIRSWRRARVLKLRSRK